MGGKKCPTIENEPRTAEGWQVWRLVFRLMGQARRAGMDGQMSGLDFGAAFQVADALGVERRVVAELMPYAEDGIVTALAKRAADRAED